MCLRGFLNQLNNCVTVTVGMRTSCLNLSDSPRGAESPVIQFSQTWKSLMWITFSINAPPAVILLSIVDGGRAQAGCLGLQASELLTLARDGRIPG